MYNLHLEIPFLPKSLNKKLRRNRFVNDRENKSWDTYLWAKCQQGKPRAPLARAQITLVRHSHRSLDFDGLVGSLKPVVDALVTAGILSDDSWKVLGAWTVDQKFRPKKAGPLLEIFIQELV